MSMKSPVSPAPAMALRCGRQTVIDTTTLPSAPDVTTNGLDDVPGAPAATGYVTLPDCPPVLVHEVSAGVVLNTKFSVLGTSVSVPPLVTRSISTSPDLI